MARSPLADAFDHHVWATLTLLDACLQLAPEQLVTAAPGTYGSILDTLQHLVESDRGYLATMTGGTLPRVDAEPMGVDELRKVMDENGPAWAALLADEPDPDRMVVRHRDDGSATEAPFGIRLAQAIHHGTDHRSQVCTALTTLGIEPPAIDVWDYAATVGRLVETPPTG